MRRKHGFRLVAALGVVAMTALGTTGASAQSAGGASFPDAAQQCATVNGDFGSVGNSLYFCSVPFSAFTKTPGEQIDSAAQQTCQSTYAGTYEWDVFPDSVQYVCVQG